MSDIKTGDRVEVTWGPYEGRQGSVVDVNRVGLASVRTGDGTMIADVDPDKDLKRLPPPSPAPNRFVKLAERALDYAEDVRGGEQANWAAIGQGYALLALATKENQ